MQTVCKSPDLAYCSNMNGFRPAAFVLAGMVFLQALSGAEQRKVRVVTSFIPIYCFTVNVAGDYAEVQNLLPANAAAHDFQLSPSDRRKLEQADLIILNGQGMEAWLGNVLENKQSQT